MFSRIDCQRLEQTAQIPRLVPVCILEKHSGFLIMASLIYLVFEKESF